MAHRDEIIQYLDAYMNAAEFTDYLPVGLLVEGRTTVHKVAAAVSASREIFEQAAEWGADMLLVHHGIFWDGESPVLKGFKKDRVKMLLDSEITLIGYHLPLDAHPEVGNNILFAQAMGWKNIEAFGSYKGKKIGFKGECDRQGIQEFVKDAQAFYGTEPTAFLDGPAEIRSAAVISGGAWDHIQEAAEEGIDCFVTGNSDEPVYNMAREMKIHFLAFGHYATERVGIRKLAEHIGEKFQLTTRFFDVDNPL
ncbi:MAG: Nif3-like dinuclear metal center hexameric protein [Candidatus Sumerlaeia bacterium]